MPPSARRGTGSPTSVSARRRAFARNSPARSEQNARNQFEKCEVEAKPIATAMSITGCSE